MLHGDDQEDQAAPRQDDPRRHFLIYFDESGMNGADYYAFGSLWLPWERRGDFSALLRRLRGEHDYVSATEIKWKRVSAYNLPF